MNLLSNVVFVVVVVVVVVVYFNCGFLESESTASIDKKLKQEQRSSVTLINNQGLYIGFNYFNIYIYTTSIKNQLPSPPVVG